MLRKIISGGQTGADMGGLDAAKQFGFETGGMAPKGYLTEKGKTPMLAEYGLIESEKSDYVPRTYDNAKNGDGTIRIAHDFNSAGELCTLKAINQYNKPYIDVNVHNPPDHEVVAQWIIDNKIEVLNVAGNRESKVKGIHEYTVNYLLTVFEILKEKNAIQLKT